MFNQVQDQSSLQRAAAPNELKLFAKLPPTGTNPKITVEEPPVQEICQDTVGFAGFSKSKPVPKALAEDPDSFETVRDPATIKKMTKIQKDKIQKEKLAQPPKPEATRPAQNSEFKKKVDEIMSRSPLRDRYAFLLPPSLRMKIDPKHQTLLDTLTKIDQYFGLLACRNPDSPLSIPVQTLIRRVRDATSSEVNIQNIQRIMHLCPTLYKLEWNQISGNPELCLTVAKGRPTDKRRYLELRSRIVEYIGSAHKEFLGKRFLLWDQNTAKTWHNEFSLQDVIIPMASLPKAKNSRADLEVALKPVAAARDVKLSKKQLFFQQLKQTVKKNEKELSAIRKTFSSKIKAEQTDEKIDSKVIIQMVRQICNSYQSKGVSSMFEVTLIQVLKKEMRSILHVSEGQTVDIFDSCIRNSRPSIFTEIANTNGVILRLNESRANSLMAELVNESTDSTGK